MMWQVTNMRYITNITIAILLLAVSIQAYHLHQELHQHLASINASLDKINAECDKLEQDSERQRQEIDRMKQDPSRSGSRRMMEITYYSPAPDENGGYDGTSSGAPLTVGRTIAANNLPFGTRVYVEGWGWGTVEDRGDLGDNQLDLCVATKQEAFDRGRHTAQVIIER